MPKGRRKGWKDLKTVFKERGTKEQVIKISYYLPVSVYRILNEEAHRRKEHTSVILYRIINEYFKEKEQSTACGQD